MDVQTIELAGRRFVVLPEEDFQSLRRLAGSVESDPGAPCSRPKFATVVPLNVGGVPASEMLLQDRR
jgi:hypothetical protein